MSCLIQRDIAIEANIITDIDDRTDSEVFAELRVNDEAWINGEIVQMYRITDLINEEDYKEAGQKSLVESGDALYELYIRTIKEFRRA